MSVPARSAFLNDMPGGGIGVFRSADLRAVEGVNEGDPLSVADDLLCDDAYALRAGAVAVRLDLRPGPTDTSFVIGPDSGGGTPGAPVHLDSLVTFMAEAGDTCEALILVELDGCGRIAEVFCHPLAPLAPRRAHVLVGIDRAGLRSRLTRAPSGGFCLGTRIALADGTVRAVEALRVGDRVLTREAGALALTGTRASTLRAAGRSAPVRIRAGAFGNPRALLVGPDLRLDPGAHAAPGPRMGVTVRAADLVDGAAVREDPGGFVDYVELRFDRGVTVFAEGIPAACPAPSDRHRANPPGLAAGTGWLPRGARAFTSEAMVGRTGRLADRLVAAP